MAMGKKSKESLHTSEKMNNVRTSDIPMGLAMRFFFQRIGTLWLWAKISKKEQFREPKQFASKGK